MKDIYVPGDVTIDGDQFVDGNLIVPIHSAYYGDAGLLSNIGGSVNAEISYGEMNQKDGSSIPLTTSFTGWNTGDVGQINKMSFSYDYTPKDYLIQSKIPYNKIKLKKGQM